MMVLMNCIKMITVSKDKISLRYLYFEVATVSLTERKYEYSKEDKL